MNEERKRVLQMVESGMIDVDEAERLLNALGDTGRPPVVEAEPVDGPGPRGVPRYLRIRVEGEKRVDVRIPIQLLRSGIKLGALLPDDARCKVDAALGEKGISFDMKGMTGEDIDEFLRQLGDFKVDVDGETETVRIYCE